MATTTTAHGESSSPTIDPKWVTRVLSKRNPYAESSVPIVMCRAPESMRSAERDVPIFDPVLVSIGLFHHGKFPAMDEQKILILNSMMDRYKGMGQREFVLMLDEQLGRKEELY